MTISYSEKDTRNVVHCTLMLSINQTNNVVLRYLSYWLICCVCLYMYLHFGLQCAARSITIINVGYVMKIKTVNKCKTPIHTNNIVCRHASCAYLRCWYV